MSFLIWISYQKSAISCSKSLILESKSGCVGQMNQARSCDEWRNFNSIARSFPDVYIYRHLLEISQLATCLEESKCGTDGEIVAANSGLIDGNVGEDGTDLHDFFGETVGFAAE